MFIDKSIMVAVPSGTVTFLFTDIQGSTSLWQEDPAAMDIALKRHDDILSKAVSQNNGHVFKTVGDAFCCVFSEAPDAVRACLAIQFIIREQEWKTPRPIRVRMSLHTGAAKERDNDFFGPPVNKVARIEALAHGGQTIMSLATAELVRESLPEGASLEDKGAHRLKDLNRPERIFQLNHTDLPGVFPPLKSMDVLPNNLPIQSTPLIGREKELETVHKLFSKEGCRLVSLVGPGGMGKTRMSLQLAADMADKNRDGTWFVDLSAITRPEGVALETAKVLNIPQKTNMSPVEVVAEVLKDKEILVVLDNFEQVKGAFEVVVAWLKVSPGVRFIITSREPLNIRGEFVFHVPPLSVPKTLGRDMLSQFEATRLFIDRAVAGDPEFQVNNDNAPIVAEICARLDGIPLAVELAAARIRLLEPGAILKRLDTRLKLLTGGPNDMPERHKTLRACIDWSYDLLSDEEQAVYRAVSVFTGGISLEGAAAVLEPVMDDELEVLDVLESLVDKSLIYRKKPLNDEPFFGILETIGEYGHARLAESGQEKDYLNRHAGYFLSVVMNAEEAWDGPDQKKWIDRISANEENIRYAMNHLAETDEGMAVISMTKAMVSFWIMRSRFSVCREWLWAALEKCSDPECGDAAWLTMQMGWLSTATGNYDESEHYLIRSLEMFSRLEDRGGESRVLDRLGFLYYSSGRISLADDKCRLALDYALEDGDAIQVAKIKQVLGNISVKKGDYDSAIKQFSDAAASFEIGGNVLRLAEVKNNLGTAFFINDDLEAAQHCYEDALPVLQQFDNQYYLKFLLCNLGELALKKGDYSTALKNFEEVKNRSVQRMDRRYTGCAFIGLAEAYLGLGDLDIAEICALESIDNVRPFGDSIEIGMAHRVIGQIFQLRNKRDDARKEFSLAVEVLESQEDIEELGKARACLDSV